MTAARRPPESAIESLTRASYFAAALDLLAIDGPAALTITALCRRLGVTKGSFYHHFDGRSQFVEALLEYWATEHAARLISVSESITDPVERVDVLKSIAVGLPHGAEAAIRGWSSHDARVARVQAEVDRSRYEHLRRSNIAVGIPEPQASMHATIAMSVLAGMQQLIRPPDPEVTRRIFDQLGEWFMQDVASPTPP